MAKSEAQTPDVMTLRIYEESRNDYYLQRLSDSELAHKISRAENLLPNVSKLPDGGARLLLHLKMLITERERRNHLKTPLLTEVTVLWPDPSEVDPDGVFLSVAHTKKGEFETGSYEKTVSSSRMSFSTAAQHDPRVDELQMEVKVLKDRMHQNDERTNRLEAMLQMLLTQQQQQFLAPTSLP